MRSTTTLRISGDDLVPDEVTRLLGCDPTYAQAKGMSTYGKVTGRERIARTGMWQIEAAESNTADLDKQVVEIFGRLSTDEDIWASLSGFRMDLFCGLFMTHWNEGLSLSPAALAALSRRGIQLSLDIYAGTDDAETQG
jgi:hypothetical protein